MHVDVLGLCQGWKELEMVNYGCWVTTYLLEPQCLGSKGLAKPRLQFLPDLRRWFQKASRIFLQETETCSTLKNLE